ncbi:MAG: DUF5320 domain-containing protein [Tissierellia bacterium]|nr:DUF5320 domain-containing protein [Tissierellia bacterium]
MSGWGRTMAAGLGWGHCGRGFRGRFYKHCRPYPFIPYEVDEKTRKAFLEEEKAMLEARLEHISELLEETEKEDE